MKLTFLERMVLMEKLQLITKLLNLINQNTQLVLELILSMLKELLLLNRIKLRQQLRFKFLLEKILKIEMRVLEFNWIILLLREPSLVKRISKL